MKFTKTKRLSALLLVLCLLWIPLSACSGEDTPSREDRESQSAGSSQSSGESSSSKAASPESTAQDPAEKPTLTVLIESVGNARLGEFAVDNGLLTTPELRDYNLQFNLVPFQDPDCSNYLTNLRVELMAGKGPDVFLADSFTGSMYSDRSPLFPFPEKLMENNTFLALDEYIANARYMEVDKLFQAAVEAGKNSQGQQMILPMTYGLILGEVEEDYPLPEDLSTREALQGSDDLYVRYMGHPGTDNDLYPLGVLADFKNEELSFTEEELLDLAMEGFAYGKGQRMEDWKKVSELWEASPVRAYMPRQYSFGYMGASELILGRSEDAPEVKFFPMRNKDDGVTATVNAYLAVNANTPYPEAAFAVIDKLLSKDGQQNAEHYWYCNGLPTYLDIGSKEDPYKNSLIWYMSENELAQLVDIREQVNAVKFYTPLDREAAVNLNPAIYAEDATEDSVKKAVHDTYMTMKMMLAES